MRSLLIAFGLCFGVLGLTFLSPVKSYFNQDVKAHSRIDHYAGHVLNSYHEFKTQNKETSGRLKFLEADGSHGLVGIDPWGRPYEYFIKPKEGVSGEVIITLWSKGKDYKTRLKSEDVKTKQNFWYKGDDFVYSKSMKI